MATKSELAANPALRNVTITRVFDAPRELVFKMWTDPKLVERWWGPKGFESPVCKLDAKQGGSIRIVMRAPDGTLIPTSGIFNEVIEPEKLVFTSIKEATNGDAEIEVLNTVVLTEENGKTVMTMKVEVIMATSEACGSVDGMNIGWNQSIDRLADLIQNLNQ